MDNDELWDFIHSHFEKNNNKKRFIQYKDLVDFIWEQTDFNMIKVKRILNSWNDLKINDGKVYGLYCFTYPELNRYSTNVKNNEISDQVKNQMTNVEDQLRNFLEDHFQTTYDATTFIYFTDFIDFIFERTDLPINKVKKILSSWRNKFELVEDRLYGLKCITDDINQTEEDRISSSSDSSLEPDDIDDEDD